MNVNFLLKLLKFLQNTKNYKNVKYLNLHCKYNIGIFGPVARFNLTSILNLSSEEPASPLPML